MAQLGESIGSIFSPKAAAPVQLPEPTPVAKMPTLNSPEVQQARKKRLADIKSSKGRDSTILDSGAASYSNQALGQ